MTEPKFTPGPWCISDERENEASLYDYSIVDANGMYVARVEDCCSLLEQEANAYLLKASPKMYRLLERLGHALFAENAEEWAEEINSLLKEARGEEQEE